MNKQHQHQKRHSPRKQRVFESSAAPAAYGSTFTSREPKYTHVKDGIIIEHCEYVGPFLSDSENIFSYYADVLTPTNNELFPWLSQIAERYESFEILEAVPMIKSSVSSATYGEFILSCDYDAEDADSAQTEEALLNFAGARNSNMWKDISMPLDRSRLAKIGPKRFNRGPTENASRLNAAGIVYWAQTPTNISGGGTPLTFPQIALGRRFITYKIRLTTPQLHSALLDQQAQQPQMYAQTNVAARQPAPTGVVVNSQYATALTNVFKSSDLALFSQLAELVTASISPATLPKFYDLTGLAATGGLNLVKLKRDFQGLIRLVLPKLAFTAGAVVTPADIGLKQWFEATNTTVGGYFDTPDLASNVWNTIRTTVVNSATDGLMAVDIAAKLAAGTIFSVTTGQTAGPAPLFVTTSGPTCTFDMCSLDFADAPASFMLAHDADKFIVAHRACKNGRRIRLAIRDESSTTPDWCRL